MSTANCNETRPHPAHPWFVDTASPSIDCPGVPGIAWVGEQGPEIWDTRKTLAENLKADTEETS